ncbi:MAG: ATP-binding protein [Firmicutes bacterium]|nr:ATP-binding protein [Bacillota bacterium]
MEITIGKFTLETLTAGMYERPKDIYREYIQNAVDSIDMAVSQELIKVEKARIEIEIDKTARCIRISDNGTGIGTDNALPYLLDIGHSPKRFTNARGFRGIGRLAGIAYCSELVFETSAAGEDRRTVVAFDAQTLCERMLNQSVDVDLHTLIADVVAIKSEQEARSRHYFHVVMAGAKDTDDILDADMVRQYLEQVAPVDFHNAFGWGKIIKSKLRAAGFAPTSYNIWIGDEHGSAPVAKAYRDTVIADRLRELDDSISEIEIKEFICDGEPIAYLWYAKTNFYGTLQEEAMKGIRLRKGNILIGDKTTLNYIFKDERFNGWLLGELHIVSDRLIPNARRDELEKNATYASLVSNLRVWAESISCEIRKISNQRSVDRKAQRIIEYAHDGATTDVEAIRTIVVPETTLMTKAETEQVNHAELIAALDMLIGAQQSITKYKALNLQTNITIEQKKVLERVFDILCSDGTPHANTLIARIIKAFALKVAASQ